MHLIQIRSLDHRQYRQMTSVISLNLYYRGYKQMNVKVYSDKTIRYTLTHLKDFQ
jgi:hypothetical protein